VVHRSSFAVSGWSRPRLRSRPRRRPRPRVGSAGGVAFVDSCQGGLSPRRDGVSWVTPHIRRLWSKNVLATESCRPLRDGFFVWHTPGNKLPGYDHSVPPGQRPSTPVREFDARSLHTVPTFRGRGRGRRRGRITANRELRTVNPQPLAMSVLG